MSVMSGMMRPIGSEGVSSGMAASVAGRESSDIQKVAMAKSAPRNYLEQP